MDCSIPGFPVHQQLLELAQTHVHWVGDAIQALHPLQPLFLLPLIFLSIWLFSSESVLHIRWPKYWSFSFSISPSNEYSALVSFEIDWLDLLAVQGTLNSLLQHHSLQASILWHSAFFMVQLSHPYMTAGKTIGLTIETFVGKVMPLLFNILSRFVIAFLPRSKNLLIANYTEVLILRFCFLSYQRFYCFVFKWSIIALQCISFCCTPKWISE